MLGIVLTSNKFKAILGMAITMKTDTIAIMIVDKFVSWLELLGTRADPRKIL